MERPIIKWPRKKTEGGVMVPIGPCLYKFVKEGDAEYYDDSNDYVGESFCSSAIYSCDGKRMKEEEPLCVGRDELSDIELYWLDKANKEKC